MASTSAAAARHSCYKSRREKRKENQRKQRSRRATGKIYGGRDEDDLETQHRRYRACAL